MAHTHTQSLTHVCTHTHTHTHTHTLYLFLLIHVDVGMKQGDNAIKRRVRLQSASRCNLQRRVYSYFNEKYRGLDEAKHLSTMSEMMNVLRTSQTLSGSPSLLTPFTLPLLTPPTPLSFSLSLPSFISISLSLYMQGKVTDLT